MSEEKKERTVYVETWTEYERGWGSRPDGFTLHIDRGSHHRFVSRYNQEHNNSAEVPDEYSQADGNVRLVKVSEKLYQKVLSSGNGMWGKGNRPRIDANDRLVEEE